LTRDSHTYSGNFVIDEAILKEEGITDMNQYAYEPNAELMPDFFLDNICQNTINASQYTILGSGSSAGQSTSAAGSGSSAPPAASAAPAEGAGQVGALIEKIGTRIDADSVKSTNAVFQFDVKGDGIYYIDLKNGAGGAGRGEAPTKADVTLIASEENFLKFSLES